MLSVMVKNLGDTVSLHCAGRIVRGEETAILCAAVRQYGQNVSLDLSQVDGIDAAGVGALIALQAAGIYLKLVNPPKVVREVLKVTGIESVFEISNGQSSGGEIAPNVSDESLVPTTAEATPH